MPWVLFAAVWGCAEATLFFIVPDVLLTWLAGFRPRVVSLATVACLVGALLGGSCMFVSARNDAPAMRVWLDRVPAISAPFVTATGAKLQSDYGPQMVRGGFTGVPYKVLAVESGAAGRSLPEFLAWSVPARLSRWIVLVAMARAIAVRVRRRLGARAPRWLWTIWAACWSIVYVVYFTVMEG